MFTNKKAWFSNSVSEKLCHLWVSEGGTIVSWKRADYLFSEDASSPDTQRVFESVDYAEDRVTVFHSLFLSTCEKTQSTESVSIGHYVLPPPCVQKEVKAAVGHFIWEQEISQKKVPCSRANIRENMVLKEDLLRPQNDCGNREGAKISQEPAILTTPQRETSPCCNVQQYPVNNMVTGYVFIDALTRYSGELHDFLPGHPDCLVLKAHNEKYTITSDEERALRNVK
ncbi:telomere repeats-binding bouquet formation protein 2 [Anguilla anguilla]|uniref:telomere repeats-binding bouquet formation protein 2 n=1 Tax=Anguilla anguilla TaxID=7936 RepID=UPI0015B346D9|nr:telomere repeats-binding bouquet formation protein 2 [Anguilla anguilla]